MPAIPPVKGTRDFYPDEMAYRNWLHAAARRVSESFGYSEYEAPYLERLDLYAAKSGDELVREQAYVFEDRGGDMIALRPELTPSLARMVAGRPGLLRPIRWWSFGPIWRYERPQKGRSREFFQWNIDLLGVESAEADAEIAAIAVELFRQVGLGPETIRLLVNNRRLAEQQYRALGIEAERLPLAFRLVDRRDRLALEAWNAYGEELGFSRPTLERLAELLLDLEGWRASEEMRRFFDACRDLGVSEYLRYEPTVVRGLDYYTGIVFEARDAAGTLRAILGGGRYDDLVADVGGARVPGVGFAMGDITLSLLIQQSGGTPALDPAPAQILVCWVEESARGESLRLAARLRHSAVRVEWYPESERLPRQLKYADRRGIPLAAILGPREVDTGQVTLKDLRSGIQSTYPVDEFLEHVVSALG